MTVLPEATLVGPVSALLRRSLFVRRSTGFDSIAVIDSRLPKCLSLPAEALAKLTEQRLRLGDFRHFRGGCKAFERGREDGASVDGAAC